MRVKPELPLEETAPFRTTLLGTKGNLKVLIEAQGRLEYHRELKDLAIWLAARRFNAELVVITSDKSTPELGTLQEMKRDGVGLLVIDNNKRVTEHIAPTNAALIVTPDPSLRYGDCAAEVECAVRKFNEVNRKDGFRDLCEIAERETKKVALVAVKKGVVTLSKTQVESMKWNNHIDALHSANNSAAGKSPVFTPQFATDLHSFRDARNLVDHPVESRAKEAKRQRLYADKMMQGPRLIAELVSIRRKIR
jgi:hypothetical protein